jgi:hypothetical protein
MENAFWYYRVTWNFDNETRHNHGFICADSCAEAAAKIDASYDDVEEMAILGMDCYEVLDFEDILDYLGNTQEDSGIGPQFFATLKDAIDISND